VSYSSHVFQSQYDVVVKAGERDSKRGLEMLGACEFRIHKIQIRNVCILCMYVFIFILYTSYIYIIYIYIDSIHNFLRGCRPKVYHMTISLGFI
jgi:hypothetical protein